MYCTFGVLVFDADGEFENPCKNLLKIFEASAFANSKGLGLLLVCEFDQHLWFHHTNYIGAASLRIAYIQ